MAQNPKENVEQLLELSADSLKAMVKEAVLAALDSRAEGEAKLREAADKAARLEEEIAKLTSQETRLAILNEEAQNLTYETWLKLGEELGFVATPEEQVKLEEDEAKVRLEEEVKAKAQDEAKKAEDEDKPSTVLQVGERRIPIKGG